jgi:hypothetical protein
VDYREMISAAIRHAVLVAATLVIVLAPAYAQSGGEVCEDHYSFRVDDCHRKFDDERARERYQLRGCLDSAKEAHRSCVNDCESRERP